MKTKLYKFTFLIALYTFVGSFSLQAGGVEILGININNIGMNKRMMRFSDNSIVLDHSALHLEGVVRLKTTGYSGQRLVVALTPLNAEGQAQEDNIGICHNLTAVNVSREGQTVNVHVIIPYQWTDWEQQENASFAFSVIVFNSDVDKVAEKVIYANKQNINLNRENAENNILLNLLSGNGSSDVDFGNVIGGLLGAPSATSESLCSSCDGLGICQECYGAAFFNPSICRRCTNDPGICRRCKGTKTEKINIELYGY